MGTRRRENGRERERMDETQRHGKDGWAVLERQRGCVGSCWLSTRRLCCTSLDFVKYPVLWVEWYPPKYMFKP